MPHNAIIDAIMPLLSPRLETDFTLFILLFFCPIVSLVSFPFVSSPVDLSPQLLTAHYSSALPCLQSRPLLFSGVDFLPALSFIIGA